MVLLVLATMGSLVLLCFPAEGLRKSPRKSSTETSPAGLVEYQQDEAMSQLMSNSHPATPECQVLGSGFGIQRGCRYSPAMESIPHCDHAAYNQACFQSFDSESVRSYSQDVRSTSDMSSLTNVVTAVEAGGFGKSASASVNYLRTSQVTEESIAFFIGAGGRTRTTAVQRPVDLKLTSAAKALLIRDPKQFLKAHGLRYVHTIAYGGSFLGSFTLNSRTTSDTTKVKTFANFSVKQGLWGASGSADFQREVAKAGSSIAISSGSKWSGGTNITPSVDGTPAGLANQFQQWSSTWRANPEPLLITTRRWIDSAEVQEIVNTMPDEIFDLFHREDYTSQVLTEISKENVKFSVLATSIERAMEWYETRQTRSLQSCLELVGREVTRRMLEITLLDDVDILSIQNQYLRGNYSWFDFNTYEGRYLECTSVLPMMFDIVSVSASGLTFTSDIARVSSVLGKPMGDVESLQILHERNGETIARGALLLRNQRNTSVEGQWYSDSRGLCTVGEPLFLRSHHNQFLRADPGGKVNITSAKGPYEQWSIWRSGVGDRVYLRSYHNQVLRADPGGNVNITSARGPYEQWTIERGGAGDRVFLRIHNQFLRADPGGKVTITSKRDIYETWHATRTDGSTACVAKAGWKVGDRLFVEAR